MYPCSSERCFIYFAHMTCAATPESILRHPALAGFLSRHTHPKKDGCLLAVFDCDGTIIKGDIGERMFFRQIEHLFFRHSPAELWSDHPDRSRLGEIYAAVTAIGKEARAQSPEFAEFASLLLTRYFNQVRHGDVVKGCVDITRLFAGFTIGEVRRFADETLREEIAAPMGARHLGGRELPRGIRYIREAVDLYRALVARGFEIYAISGSNRWSVEQVFAQLGLATDRVIGIDLEDDAGVLTARSKEPVPIHENKLSALEMVTRCRPLLVASDSKRDLPLLLSSSELKVRIDSKGRDKDEFFAAAGAPPDDSWVLIDHPTLLESLAHG
jgi:phosphoserine phosphatase